MKSAGRDFECELYVNVQIMTCKSTKEREMNTVERDRERRKKKKEKEEMNKYTGSFI